MYADRHFFGFFRVSENDSSDRSSRSYRSLSVQMLK